MGYGISQGPGLINSPSGNQDPRVRRAFALSAFVWKGVETYGAWLSSLEEPKPLCVGHTITSLTFILKSD